MNKIFQKITTYFNKQCSLKTMTAALLFSLCSLPTALSNDIDQYDPRPRYKTSSICRRNLFYGKKYKNIIFDADLFFIVSENREYSLLDQKLDSLNEKNCNSSLFLFTDFLRGFVTAEEIAQKLSDGDKAAEYNLLDCLNDTGNDMVVHPKAVSLVKLLKKIGYNVYIIHDSFAGLSSKKTTRDFINIFDGSLTSYETHSLRPCTRIYEQLISKYDLDSEECLLIDQKENALVAYQHFLMDSIDYTLGDRDNDLMNRVEACSDDDGSLLHRVYYEYTVRELANLGVFDVVKEEKELNRGVTYKHIQRHYPQRISAHIIRIDRYHASLHHLLANDTCVGLAYISDMIKTKDNALVGINASFTDEQGVPAGVLKIGNSWITDQKCPRGALGWKESNKSEDQSFPTLIDILDINCVFHAGGKILAVDRVNQKRKADDAIIYTPLFGQTTQTDNDGVEIIVADGMIKQIGEGKGNSDIPADGFVLSIGNDHPHRTSPILMGELLSMMHGPASFNIVIQTQKTDAELWRETDYIVGGTPVLVKDGEVVENFLEEKVLPSFLEQRYARTAVGILDNGDWLLFVIDNNDTEGSNGATMSELAHFVKSFGCKDAINLCGARSSTMVFEDEKINVSSGPFSFAGMPDFEKSLGDCIVVSPKKVLRTSNDPRIAMFRENLLKLEREAASSLEAIASDIED